MSYANDNFIKEVSSSHIQWEQMEEFSKLCEEGKAISGISEEEFYSLLQDLANDKLTYSNDSVIDMIIKFVLEGTSEEKLINILRNLKIANVDKEGIVGTAYPKYIDGSYYIEIGSDIEKRVRLLSDMFAVLFMFNEHLEDLEYRVLCSLAEVTQNRYCANEEFTDDFNNVQIYMILCDGLYKDDFTDRYIAYAREIHEMAMAFLIGHEIGHHYYENTTVKPNPGMESKVAELKADAFALDFSFKYLRNAYANDENFYGIHCFAGVYLPLIASAKICKSVFEDEENHPSIVKRLLGVQRGMQKILTETGWEDTKRYRDLLLRMVQFPMQAS